MSRFHGFLLELNRVVSQRRRTRRREVVVRCAALACLGWGALGIFDWIAAPATVLRLVLLWMVLPAVVWTAGRFWRRRWTVAERPVHVARRATRSRRLVGDVLAAIEYQLALDGPLATYGSATVDTGSAQLKQAVIRDVAGQLDQIDVSGERLSMSRGGWLAVAGLLLATVMALCVAPYSWAHVQRSFGLAAPYPTRSRIVAVTLGGRNVPLQRSRLDAAWVVRNESTELEFRCEGELPEQVEVWLRDGAHRLETQLETTRAERADESMVWRATLPPLDHSAELRIVAGDALTLWSQLTIRDRPRVEPRITVVPPRYSGEQSYTTTDLQLQVLPGSQITVALHSPSELTAVEARRTDLSESAAIPFRWDAHAKQWTLAGRLAELESVLQPQQLEIQLWDTHHLSLPIPLRLDVRLGEDQPPTVEAVVEYQFALRDAQPRILFRAADDFALQAVQLDLTVPRHGAQRLRRQLWTAGERPETEVVGQFALDLEPLELLPGDELICTPLAIDSRRPLPGLTTTGRPFVLRIGEPSDVFAEVTQLDAPSQQQLEAIIDQVIGAGDAEEGP